VVRTVDVQEGLAHAGVHGTSGWVEIDQSRIDRLAGASGDYQWLHIDPQWAADGPLGRTIAHGYLTLALVVPLLWQLVRISENSMVVNCGLKKVLLPAAVPVGSRARRCQS
jgi:acyl dehydratase